MLANVAGFGDAIVGGGSAVEKLFSLFRRADSIAYRMSIDEIAKFRFCPVETVQVFAPMTKPSRETSGPPLFPGKIGAVV